MNGTLVWQLAWRYLRGKRGANAVPILSRISMFAIAISTGAMIILFSVFNGFEHLVQDLYKAFYPELKITAARGKFFPFSDAQLSQIKQMADVKNVSLVLEDNVLLNSNDGQRVATVKGVDRNYFEVNNIKPYIKDGIDTISASYPTAIVGMQIQNEMGLDVNNVFSMLKLYYPNASAKGFSSLDPESALQSLTLRPDGVFQVQDEFDSKYLLAPLPLIQTLLQAEGRYSSIELSLQPGADAGTVKKALKKMLGRNYKIATRYEQNETLYMVMRAEKWAVYAILTLVLLIASLNMIGALTLLVLEKQKDVAILSAMGAQPSTIRNIFITEGLLWALTGGLSGLVLGGLLCLGQKYFQIVKMDGSFIIDAYPVAIEAGDFALIIATIVAVGLLAGWFPAKRAARTEAPSLKST